jgi:amino acid adenylation domain-containing protein
MNGDSQYDGIAIIGMAGRFPGADSVEEFWDNLVHGRESVSFFSDAELRDSGLDPDALRSRGRYVAARGLLKDIECFDAAFFGIHPREAEVMDPQQRIFLETCWAALERAGYAPNQIDAIVGVFGGVSFNTFYLHALHGRPDLLEMVGPEQVMFGNEKDYVTTRVAYKLGLKGPALNVSTACSTSLVAVAQACQSLLTYQCDFALAGGASVTVPQVRGYFHDEGNIGSADGHTRTFDAQASGTAFGNGVGIVVLKRLEDAMRDHDQVFAVIKGAALNNDGSQRVSFGAPGVDGQAKVISLAHALAGVEPRSISYVEAHGTATPLGDPIEVAGLTKAFREGTDARQFCAIGSVKSNTGHLDVAAGVTSLIKTALALHHKVLPASLHYTSPNPKLNLESSPFFVNAKLRDWERENGIPRRAGVSSFGTGGTNGHVILEEAPELPLSDRGRPWQLLPLSAKTSDALERATAQLSDYLKKAANSTPLENQPAALADAAFTLQSGRTVFPHRRMVVCRGLNDGAAALEARDSKRVFSQHEQGSDPPVVFMFPGQGAQYPGMGSSLYESEPVFRENMDRCFAILKPLLATDLRAVMFPESGSEKDSQTQLQQTALTQPALFVIEYALAKLWMSWGIAPAAMIGHSVGEYVAGCLAGVFQLEDALTLVARRGALVQAQPGGAMLIVRQAEGEVLPLLTPELGIAAVNSPNLCVVSGPYQAVESLEKTLEIRGIATKRLQTSHAFHSAMMDPVLEPFGALLKKVPLCEPHIPYVSNVTANWITAAEATNPAYWAGHVRQTVRFAQGVAKLTEEPRNVLLEVGPGQTLSTLTRQHPAKRAEQNVFASLPLSGEQELRGFHETLGRLWMSGVKIDWAQFHSGESRRRVTLPSYPFERKRYWPQGAVKPAPTIAPESKPGADPSFPASVPSTVPAETNEPFVASRKERLVVAVRSLLGEFSGYDLSEADPSADLMELGFDSLLLTQGSQVLHRKFGINITFRQLMEELSSIQSIAGYLDDQMPPEAFAESRPAAPPVITNPETSAMATPNALTLEYLFQQQQQLTAQLLQLMGRQSASAGVQSSQAVPPTTPAPSGLLGKSEGDKPHGPFKPFDRHAATALNPVQTQALDRLIGTYTAHSAKSKALAAQNRPILADPRSAAGFNRLWKEMVYPIVTTRSDGSKVWDVDGHEYVDFVMGFGASLFGHRPPFVLKAVEEQLKLGFEIGPIQPIAGEVAALLREFIGMDRVAFTNTGSEAVLAATRVARTVTGRSKIAVFAGAYHGIFDEVLFRPLTVNGELRTAPIAPGVPQSAVSEVIVLDYGNPQSLEILRSRGSEIAAVLVEPVQSRRLDLQPKEFLHQLREVASEIGAALVFDEVVTGFRVEPGGAQSYFGVRADLATYGKVIGGGLPIGVVAGSTKYMDALDGGSWQYGDASFPEVGVTFFAGTFVRHPLVLAAAKAVLTHLKQNGRQLQDALSSRTARLAEQLRAVIAELDAPYTVTQFSSLIHINFPPNHKLAGLLYYLLRLRGIHIWDNRALILTTAHSQADLDLLVRSLRESLQEMRASGFIAGPEAAALKPSSSSIAVPTAIESGAAHTDDASSFPLTEAQKEVWLAAQMGGEAAVAYNESLKLEFRGDFDIEAFRQSIRTVVKRHPILMASIDRNGQSQRLQPSLQLELPLIDLGARPEAQAAGLKELIEREISYRFDLATGPLLRVQIVRLSSDHHVVIWTAHHIVCDGWSGGLIVNELGKIYSALKANQPAKLDAPNSFRDYVRTTEGDPAKLKQAISYWTEKFAAIPPPLDLPADRPRSPVRTARASTVKHALGAGLQQNLKRFAGQRRTTLVVLLLSAFKTLLHRLSGQSDLVVGLPVAGQATSGQTCLVGHCVNLVPIRSELKPDESFESNLVLLKKNILDAYDHSQTTIGGILQHIAVSRTPDRPPLVEVIFNVDRELSDVEFHNLQFTCERNAKRALHYDLFLNVVEGPRGIYAECDFNPDLFDSATILRWLGHYETLLESILGEPSNSLAKLKLLSAAESNTILETWNNTKAEYHGPALLHQLVEQQVGQSPDAPAVTFGEQTISYYELNKRANQLAHLLRSLNVGPEALVGVFLERSVEMVVALLGVLKSGGAYVPIDPEYPPDRIAFMVRDSNCSAVLAAEHLRSRLPAVACPVVDLTSDWPRIALQPGTNPEPLATSDNLSYVIYTSGSTGNPKGAMNTHRGIRNRLLWMQNEYPMTPKDRVLQKTPFSFDVSVWEFFWPLISGAHLIVAKPGGHREADYLVRLIRDREITTIHFVPSMLAAFLSERDVNLCTSLRQVICSGEALSVSLERELFRLLSARLFNLYGPTETSVEVTYWECDRNSPLTTVPIGRPVGNTQTYVLDRHMNPVPIGVPGELFLGGVQVGRGYWNRPELTAEKFVSHPFSKNPQARLYRTGDLCRWLPNGAIDYLGRLDFQVKIHGLRIELGEIEAALNRYEFVRQSVVVAHESNGDKTLVAYLEPRNGIAPSVSDLRAHLKRDLPEYMVPSEFVTMNALPISPNGKVDRKALPNPQRSALKPETDFAAPSDPLEQMLTRLWAKVLRIKRVGLHDNFFELGGHSLLALRISVEIERLCKKRLPLATFFQAPTVAQLAAILRRENWTPSWQSLVPIRASGSKSPLFLVHGAEGNVLLYHSVTQYLDPDQPVYGLQSRGLSGTGPFHTSIPQMAAEYIKEIMAVQPRGPYLLGGYCMGGSIAFEMARQLTAMGENIELLILLDSYNGKVASPLQGRLLAPVHAVQNLWFHARNFISIKAQDRGKFLKEKIDVELARFRIKLQASYQALKRFGSAEPLPSHPHLRILEANHRALLAYEPAAYGGRVVLVRPKGFFLAFTDPQYGWKDAVDRGIEICELPVYPKGMLVEPFCRALAGTLTTLLAQPAAAPADDLSPAFSEESTVLRGV